MFTIHDLNALFHVNPDPEQGEDAGLDPAAAAAAGAEGSETAGAGDKGGDKPAKEPAKPTEAELEKAGVSAMAKAMLDEVPEGKKDAAAVLERQVTGKKKPEQSGEKPEKAAGDTNKKPEKADSEKLGPDGKPLKPDAKDPAKPDAKPEAAKPGDPDPKVEEEIASLKLGEKGAARFRELTDTIKTKDLSLEAVSKIFGAEGKTAEELIPQVKQVLADADFGRQWMESIEQTGLEPNQFGEIMAVATLRWSGDPTQQRKAFDEITRYRDELAAELGIATDTVDPLVAHAALLTQEEKERLATGDLGQGDARKLLELRVQAQKREQVQTQQRQQVDQRNTATALAADAGKAVVDFTTKLRLTDPETFDRTFEFLKPKIARIQQNSSPAKWSELIAAEFTENMPLFKAAKADPPAKKEEERTNIGRVPGRANGAAGRPVQALVADETNPANALAKGMLEALQDAKADRPTRESL